MDPSLNYNIHQIGVERLGDISEHSKDNISIIVEANKK